MAVARHSESIELQEADHTNYENDTTITARRIQVEMSVEGHYERLDLQKTDDAVYGDLQTQKEKDLEKILQSVKRVLRVVAVCLGMLCLMLLGVIIGLAVHYNSVINNLTLKGNQLKVDYTNLILTNRTLTNLTLERNQSKFDYTNLTLERNQLKTDYTNLMLENNQLRSEVNQFKAVKSCPDGWRKFGDRCYYRSTGETTWEESRKECVKAGADLMAINSKEEQELIRRLNHGCEVPSSKQTWIGLKKMWNKWTWVDGSAQTTQYWARGYPRIHTYWNCAYYWQSNGLLYDGLCSEKRTWICEK